MKHYVDAYVVCPFYKGEDRQVIYCEGAEKNSSIHMAFATQQQKKDYKSCYCKRYRGKCLIAESLNRKWEGSGDNE